MSQANKMQSDPFSLKRWLVEHLFGLRQGLWPVLDLLDGLARALTGRLRYPPLSARQKVSGQLLATLSRFDAIGRDSLRMLQDFTHLQPHHRVLDMGCGCGRLAWPLLQFLHPTATYHGGDVDASMLAWCQRSLASRHPNASFFHIDVFNSFYTPSQRGSPGQYRFPLPDGAVDRVFLGSVFTHMQPADVAAYLGEIARVLAPDGCALASFFLLTERRLQGPARPVIDSKFPFPREHHRLASEKVPELDVALDEAFLLALLDRAGLRCRGSILWGAWAGEPGVSGQDFVVIERRPAPSAEPRQARETTAAPA